MIVLSSSGRFPGVAVGLLTALLMPAVVSSQGQGQGQGLALANRAVPVTSVPEAPICSRCRIIVQDSVQLHHAGTAGELSDYPRSIARLSDGRFVVPSVLDGLFVFDAQGHFVSRVGRPGDGPGEFRRPRFVSVGPGDTVMVYDTRAARISLYDRQMRFVRSVSGIFNPLQVLSLTDGTILSVGTVGTRERIGLLYHLTQTHGDALLSIGYPPVEVNPVQPFETFRKAGAGRAGRFWSAREFYKYRLEEWSTDGHLLRVLEPRSRWFPANSPIRGEAPGRVTPDKPALPDVMGIWTDPEGRVWIAARVPDPGSRSAFERPVTAEGEQHYPIRDVEAVWNTIIEVIDPTRGRVVARAEFPWVVLGTLGRNRVFAISKQDDGTPVVTVVELSLLTQ